MKAIAVFLTLAAAYGSFLSFADVRECGGPDSMETQGKARCTIAQQLNSCECTDAIQWEPVRPGIEYEIQRCRLTFQTRGPENLREGKDPAKVRVRGCEIVGRTFGPPEGGFGVWSLWDDSEPMSPGLVYRYQVRVEGSDPTWKLAPMSFHRAWPRMCVDTETGEFAPCPEIRP